ncbi:TetR/AcrR family transcriptional regulator [Frankia sp. AgB32]|uniref:TetR/AcrR family transcriptional regulator n=1 Tax=Frankia sp. AgB32 TaxID=631119 RepID=UPI00200EC8BC|nr:TetR/AcrR family transcriptional regulator C-terminal domain-containing protein [Frankia sp. AgB32]MCK9893141.1 TetR/AcrR family transcriptional regulator C-terminal domain-containing protein [Frankia sp. AgB32]
MAAPADPAVEPGRSGHAALATAAASRPRLHPELLARAAIDIADVDGLAAVSMRRLATTVGVGTMTLYYHVRDKDELLDLMWDEFMGEHLLAEVPADWRTALTAIAQRTRESYQRHPWALHVVARPARGPNKMRHIEQYLTVVSMITDDLDEQLRILHSVSDLVVGCTLRELGVRAFPPPTGNPADSGDPWAEVLQPMPDFGELVRAEDLPRLRNLWTSGCLRRPTRFEQALGWLLDGIGAAHPEAVQLGAGKGGGEGRAVATTTGTVPKKGA